MQQLQQRLELLLAIHCIRLHRILYSLLLLVLLEVVVVDKRLLPLEEAARRLEEAYMVVVALVEDGQ